MRLGLAARKQAAIKVRQPLHAAVVVASERERTAIQSLAEVVREELNVRELRFVAAADELGHHEVKANYRTLGPRFGSSMPQAAAAIAALDPDHVAAALREGRSIGISVDGHDHRLGEDLTSARSLARGQGYASSARAHTRSRSSSRSTMTCAARAAPARSCTRSRTPASTRASPSRTASS